MKKRILAALLCSAILTSSFVSCSESETNSSETQEEAGSPSEEIEIFETEPAHDETDRSQMKDSLPSDLDFSGSTVKFLLRGGIDENELLTELTGDIVDDAVYNRNLSVQERLNVKFDLQSSGNGTAQEMPSAVTNSILAGSYEYDIIAWAQYVVLPLSLKNMFLNLVDAPYIDLEQPWWNKNYIDAISIGNNSRFFLVGDVNLTALKNTSAAFFNKKLFSDYIGSVDEFYTTVSTGGWTVDLCKNYSEAVYTDVNGNGVVDDGDIYGLAGTTVANTEHYAIACDMEFSQRDEDGIPYITLNSDRSATIVEKLYDLYYNNKGMMVLNSDSSFVSDSLAKIFSMDQLLFMPIWVQTCDYLRDMESDYGIIPYPKLDEAQEDYRTLVHDTASMFCIPTTCNQSDTVCAVLEAMSAESYRTVTPAYYEVALKQKYARDSLSVLMIDIIHNNASTDFIYAYNYGVSSMGTIMRDIIGGKNNNFASVYKKRERAAVKGLEKIINMYTGGEQ